MTIRIPRGVLVAFALLSVAAQGTDLAYSISSANAGWAVYHFGLGAFWIWFLARRPWRSW